jgi:endonuclease/exonuclease/phosphatase family metal-dependent hydrolase
MKLKLMCLNLWNGGELFETIKDFIGQEKADIVALQEVWHAETHPPHKKWHIVSELTRLLGYKHYAFAPGSGRTIEGGVRVQQGNAILSQFPIQSSETIFYDLPYDGVYTDTPGDYQSVPRNLQHGKINIDNTVLHIFNTQGIWGFDGDDNERRLNMGDIIAREIAGKKHALLMGDFNVGEGTQTVAKIEAHMRNIFKGELKTSFNMRHKSGGGFASAVVDMIFASPDIKIGNHSAAEANVSDHLALVTEFEIQT